MKWKKTDSEKIANVIAAKVADPDKSLRDIQEETGVNYKVAGDILKKDLDKIVTSSNKAKELFDYNMEIINAGAMKVAKAMQTMNPEDIREAKEMQAIVETAFKQNQLLEGKSTENVDIKLKWDV